ncbi:MAG: hypothetical protein ACREAS_05070, partial [Nitrososphaera sp.]
MVGRRENRETFIIFGLLLLVVLSMVLVGSSNDKLKAQANELEPIECPVISHRELNRIDIANHDFYKSILGNLTDEIEFKLNISENNPQGEMLEDLQSLLTARKALLLKMYEYNRTQAILSIQALDGWNKILAVTQNCVEKPETISGKLGLTIYDDLAAGTSHEDYEVITKEKRIITLYPSGNITGSLTSGDEVSVSGYLLDDTLIFGSALTGEGINSSEIEVTRDQLPLVVKGPQRIAVILANFADTDDPRLNPNAMEDLIFNQLDMFYALNSGERISLTGNVFGPYRLSSLNHCPIQEEHLPEVLEEADNDIYYPSYNRIFIIAPYSGGGCNNNGWTSDIGVVTPISTPDGQVNMSVSNININSMNVSNITSSTPAFLGTIGHE